MGARVGHNSPGISANEAIHSENVWSAARLQGLVWSRRQVCANVFGLYVEIFSPAMMSCARIHPYKPTGC